MAIPILKLIDMLSRQFQFSISAAVVLAATGILLFSGCSKKEYRLDQLKVSSIAGLNEKDYQRIFISSPFPHLILKSMKSRRHKYIFNTADCGIVKHGYKNRVELFVVYNHNGRIENVILGKNIETPSLVEKMRRNGFFQHWDGEDKYSQPDNVTGATYSCKAVSESVSALFLMLSKEKIFGKSI